MTPDRAIWEDYARHGVALHLHRARLRRHLPADRTFHVREALPRPAAAAQGGGAMTLDPSILAHIRAVAAEVRALIHEEAPR